MQPTDPTAVEAALTLCAINGRDSSAVDDWLETAEELRQARLQEQVRTSDNIGLRDNTYGWPGSTGKKKTISKTEKKKRSKARLMNKRRKK